MPASPAPTWTRRALGTTLVAGACFVATSLPSSVSALLAQSISVKDVRPARVTLEAGGARERVVLTGAGLGAVTSASVMDRRDPVREVAVEARLTGRDELTVTLQARATAPSLTAALALRTRDGTTTTVPGLTVTVAATPPAVTDVVVRDRSIVAGDRSAVTVALSAPAPKGLVVRLDASERILDLPAQVEAEAGLSEVRVPFVAGTPGSTVVVGISAGTESGSARTEIEVRPRPFTALHRATPALVFTGLRFEPLRRTTPGLVFTGLRFEPVRRTTPALLFSGLRFQPVRRTTPPLVFTGRYSDIVR